MKNTLFPFLAFLGLNALACMTPGPAPDGGGVAPNEAVAEAPSALLTPCSSSCDCDLGFMCYPAGTPDAVCIPDMFGPPAPVCFEDCQCEFGEICGPWMLCEVPTCFSDCDCDGGDYCYRGSCLRDPGSFDECTANCQCPDAGTCQNGHCVSGGGYYQPN